MTMNEALRLQNETPYLDLEFQAFLKSCEDLLPLPPKTDLSHQ